MNNNYDNSDYVKTDPKNIVNLDVPKEEEINSNNTRDLDFNKSDHIESVNKIEPIQLNVVENINKDSAINTQPEVREVRVETLDESICETIMRDVKLIGQKLKYVLLPRFNASLGQELKKWDLWGPLLFCLLLSITIALGGNYTFETTGNVFIIIFVVIWIGGLIISLNSQFLGVNINFLQSICLLGYCVFPIDVSAILIRLIGCPNWIKLIIVALACVWSCIASIGYISGIVTPEKKIVAVYPVFLFYLTLSFFVLFL